MAAKRAAQKSSQKSEVVLYRYSAPRPRLFLVVLVSSGIQVVFWSCFSIASLVEYRRRQPEESGPSSTGGSSNGGLLQFIKEKSSSPKWQLGFSLFALSLGGLFTCISVYYPRRTVNKVLFNSARKSLEITTYTPMGGLMRIKEIPYLSVKRKGSAKDSLRSYLPLKVEGRAFHYLLDKTNGTFPNAKLFDTVIAAKQ